MPNKFNRIIAWLHSQAIQTDNPVVYQTIIRQWNSNIISARLMAQVEKPEVAAALAEIRCNNSLSDCWKEIKPILERAADENNNLHE